METDLINDRGCGPEITGTRITVYNLLTHFLDPTATEAYICGLYELTAEQVAAARAYVLNNAETVLARHLEIEARMADGNPPEVLERAKQTHATFMSFKDSSSNVSRLRLGKTPLSPRREAAKTAPVVCRRFGNGKKNKRRERDYDMRCWRM